MAVHTGLSDHGHRDERQSGELQDVELKERIGKIRHGVRYMCSPGGIEQINVNNRQHAPEQIQYVAEEYQPESSFDAILNPVCLE